jgi:DNA processing protein
MLSALSTLACLRTTGVGIKTTVRAQRLANGDETNASDLALLLYRVKEEYPRTRLPGREKLEAGIDEAAGVLDECQEQDIAVIPYGHNKYPSSLHGLEEPPPMLYRRGSSDSIQTGVAIVGTRSPSTYGKRCARRLGELFGEAGFWVVSGLALGCDRAAHEGCLKAGGKTSAVLAHGLDSIYPTSNRDLADRILDEEGSLWSEHGPGVSPKAHQYVQRNRIQSGLTGGVIVVEAGPESGTLHTAEFAREQGRLLGCLTPGAKSNQKLQAGNEKLLSEGAFPIRGPGDIERFAAQIRDSRDG